MDGWMCTQGKDNDPEMKSSCNDQLLAREIFHLTFTTSDGRKCIANSCCTEDNTIPAFLPAAPHNKPPLVVREVPPQQVYFMKGEVVTLKCIFEGGLDVSGVFWFNEEDQRVPFISENPRCEDCAPDPAVPKDDVRRTAPIRAYFYQEQVVFCPYTIKHFTAELIINTSQVNISNGATYTCAGSSFDGSSISYSTSLRMREGV